MDQKWAKNSVLWILLKNLVINFYWICSIVRIYIICCYMLFANNIILFLRYGPKCFQPIRLQDFLINYISRTNQWNSLIFLHVDTNSHKLKVDQKLCVAPGQKWVWPVLSWDFKIDCIKNEQMEWTDFCMLVQIQES